jgi:hypothetical protein
MSFIHSETKDFFVAYGALILPSQSSKWLLLFSFTLCSTLLSEQISLDKFHTRPNTSHSQSGCEGEEIYSCPYRKYIANELTARLIDVWMAKST